MNQLALTTDWISGSPEADPGAFFRAPFWQMRGFGNEKNGI